MRSLEEIITDINTVKNQLYDEAVKLKDIDEKSGEAVLSAVSSVGLQALGIRVVLPKEVGFWTIGVFGFILSIRKQNRIRPVAKRLKELEKQYNELVNEYESVVLNTQAKTLKNPLLSEDFINLTNKLKQDNERNSSSSVNTTVVWSVVAFFLFVLGFYYFKKRSAGVVIQ